MITDWKNKKVAVLGFGVEGLSSVRFLHKNGISAWVLDKKKKEDLDQQAYSEVEKRGAKFMLGDNYLKDFAQFNVIIRSPGVKLSTQELVQAKEKGAVITSQTKLFFDLCPCPIIGVTGTKGKGTTSTLIYEMLKAAGKGAYLGGNVGVPVLSFLDKLQESSWVVLELSSFQLQDLDKSPHFAKASRGKPHIAVMLMVTSEHLDYHKDISEYVAAKRNLLRFQTPDDFAILNRDYPATNESDIYTEGKVYFVSREREVEEGCFVKDGKIILRIGSVSRRGPVSAFLPSSAPAFAKATAGKHSSAASPLEADKRSGGGSPSSRATPALVDSKDQEIVNIKDILLPGKHNLENVCAAVMAATLAGVTKDQIVKVLKSFKGLEHRLELVREVHGVKYYDDSFSTTPETAIAAIEAFNSPEILILGGSSKSSDFTQLGKVISEARNIKAIIGIGHEWERMKTQFRIQNSEFRIIEGLKSMEEIVQKAAEIAQRGDVVILSPACASFGMFKNYKDRGEQFKREVMKQK